MNNKKHFIYIHEYYTGKFNSAKHIRVYDDYESALNQKHVLGGTIKVCNVTAEIY